MSAFDDLLQRLTHRLRIDPELQREVSAELRTHLEASTHEFLAAGMGDGEARAAAVKALGNEAEVSEQLWSANRRRVRLRKAARWAIGATLGPAAVVASVAIAWGAIVSLAVFVATLGSLSFTGLPTVFGQGDLIRGVDRYARHKLFASVPPAERLASPWDRDTPEARIERARTLAELHPRDPLYWANYAVKSLLQRGVLETLTLVSPTALSQPAPQTRPAAMQQVLQILDRGKELEPDNAFYPWMKATILFHHSTKPLLQPTDKAPLGFSYVDAHGKNDRWQQDRFEVLDRAMYEQALAELREAARKPYLDAYAMAFAEHQLNRLPPPTRLSDHLLAVQLQMSVLLPHFNVYREAIHIAGAEAIQRAAAGRRDEGLQLVRDARTIAVLAAQRSRSVIELMVASSMYGATTAQEVLIWKEVGSEPQAAEAFQRMERFENFRRAVRERANNDPALNGWFRQLGMSDRIFARAGTDPGQVNPAPGRKAEYAVLDQLALVLMLLSLIAAAALPATRALAARLRAGRWPVVTLMKWRVLAKVISISVILPVAVFAFYAYLTPLGGRNYGTTASLERICVEYAAVACAILVLLRLSIGAEMKRRANELELDELAPRRISRAKSATGILLAVLVVVYLIVWHWSVQRTTFPEAFPTRGAGYALAFIVMAYALSWTGSHSAVRAVSRGWWGRIPWWVNFAGVLAVVFGGSWMFANMRPGTRLDDQIAFVCLILFFATLLAALAITVRRRWRSGGRTEQPRFSYGLSVAPAILLSAVALAVLCGIPLRLQERRNTAAMAAPGGSPSFLHEVDQSYWRILRERLANAESDEHMAPAQLLQNH